MVYLDVFFLNHCSSKVVNHSFFPFPSFFVVERPIQEILYNNKNIVGYTVNAQSDAPEESNSNSKIKGNHQKQNSPSPSHRLQEK